MTPVFFVEPSAEARMTQSQQWQWIPTHLTPEQFEEFVLPHLHIGSRGPQPKLSLHAIFNYILKLLYLGCQWQELPIEKDKDGRPEIHYTRIYRAFRRYEAQGCFNVIFASSVLLLHQHELLDVSVIHGDGTTTAAKKGGDQLGYSGHKHLKGDKVVALCDRHCNVIAPFISAPGNRNESPLLKTALPQVTRIAQQVGLDLNDTIVSLDGVYDSSSNRKAIFNRGMIPNIPENLRGRKTPKRGRKPMFDPTIFQERFRTIERVFADLERRFGRFVVFDLHTYNHRRLGPHALPADPRYNPEINLGTRMMNRNHWKPVVESFLSDLRDFDFLGRPLDVRENVRFRGGYFPYWVHQTFPHSACVLSIEVKKFFMDEWTNNVDLTQLDAIRCALQSTIPSVLEALNQVDVGTTPKSPSLVF